MTEQTETHTSPEHYMRISITKNSKGYVHETTVSLRWPMADYPYAPTTTIKVMLEESDRLAREEITRREKADVE